MNFMIGLGWESTLVLGYDYGMMMVDINGSPICACYGCERGSNCKSSISSPQQRHELQLLIGNIRTIGLIDVQ